MSIRSCPLSGSNLHILSETYLRANYFHWGRVTKLNSTRFPIWCTVVRSRLHYYLLAKSDFNHWSTRLDLALLNYDFELNYVKLNLTESLKTFSHPVLSTGFQLDVRVSSTAVMLVGC